MKKISFKRIVSLVAIAVTVLTLLSGCGVNATVDKKSGNVYKERRALEKAVMEVTTTPVTNENSAASTNPVTNTTPTKGMNSLAGPTAPTNGRIGIDAAKEIALKYAGMTDVIFDECEYDREDGTYDLEFSLNGMEYDYEVDASTGKIVKAETEKDDDFDDDDFDYDDDD